MLPNTAAMPLSKHRGLYGYSPLSHSFEIIVHCHGNLVTPCDCVFELRFERDGEDNRLLEKVERRLVQPLLPQDVLRMGWSAFVASDRVSSKPDLYQGAHDFGRAMVQIRGLPMEKDSSKESKEFSG
jgi:hypothetical protein